MKKNTMKNTVAVAKRKSTTKHSPTKKNLGRPSFAGGSLSSKDYNQFFSGLVKKLNDRLPEQKILLKGNQMNGLILEIQDINGSVIGMFTLSLNEGLKNEYPFVFRMAIEYMMHTILRLFLVNKVNTQKNNGKLSTPQQAALDEIEQKFQTLNELYTSSSRINQ
jgi:hypothetical protein